MSTEGSRSLRVGNHRDATLLASSNLTLDCGTNVDGQNGIGTDSFIFQMPLVHLWEVTFIYHIPQFFHIGNL